jgi:hypothetical protein
MGGQTALLGLIGASAVAVGTGLQAADDLRQFKRITDEAFPRGWWGFIIQVAILLITIPIASLLVSPRTGPYPGLQATASRLDAILKRGGEEARQASDFLRHGAYWLLITVGPWYSLPLRRWPKRRADVLQLSQTWQQSRRAWHRSRPSAFQV